MTMRTPTPSIPESDHRRNNFDFLRFALASLVIFSHSYPLSSGPDTVDPLMRATRGQMDFGALAVDGFFAISGFLIAMSWLRSGGWGNFLRKRVLRIYPGFVVAMLFCAVVVVPLSIGQAGLSLSPRPLATFFYRTFLLQPYHNTAAFADNPYPGIVNGSAWTILYEFWCYILIGLLATIGLVAKPRRLLAVGIVVLGTYAIVDGFDLQPAWQPLVGVKVAYHLNRIGGDLSTWPRFLTFFLAGSVYFCYRERIPRSKWLVLICVTLLIAAARIEHAPLFAFPIAGTYLLFFIAFTPVGLERFGKYGDFSYGIYLYAYPIQQLLVQKLGITSPLLLFGYSLVLSILAGMVSWYAVERWFLRAKRKRAPQDVMTSVGSASAGPIISEASVSIGPSPG
jgi:peptidoglycan/LPS O-acetylase OafA/YrhL